MSLKHDVAKILAQSNIIRRIASLIANQPSADVDAFFKAPYETRASIVRELHSLDVKMSRISDEFPNVPDATMRAEIQKAPRYADDVMVALVKHMRPENFLQIGCWSMGELNTLAQEGYSGGLIATDFNAEYLEAIKSRYRPKPGTNFQFRTLDIESAKTTDFQDVQFISAIQVLANIQPEGMKRFAAVLRESPSVRALVIGDNMTFETLDPDSDQSSIRHPIARNWIHNYAKFARDAGFAFAALPDLTLNSTDAPRGVFILTRGETSDQIAAAIGQASLRFIERQAHIWRSH